MNARLMDLPEDYKKLGVNPDKIEVWEDRRRNPDSTAGNWEWWYFDSILDDGTKVVIQFFTKAGMRRIQKDGDQPSVTLKITRPDGKQYERDLLQKATNCHYGNDNCDVHLGNNSFVGDLKTYQIHVEQDKGVGADLTLVSQAKPYRPGTAYFDFGNDEYYTWLCAVPKGEVTGTITVDGKTISVHGSGYHDHQWSNRFYLTEWNNWLWARQSFDDYSVLLFDFITSDDYGNKRFPILFVQDKEGNIVFENKDTVKCTVGEFYVDEKASGKDYPKILHYEMQHGDIHLTYDLESEAILEAQGMKNVPFPVRMISRKYGMEDLSYSRYSGKGALVMEESGERVERSGELIYEFMFPGKTCKEYLEN